ncbi:MAG: B12-binding domain-containing radical SAM protein [Eubacterium sp.]|nr:B12-binding domain-containing radical SAM protein [Eubacterium sp.]
MSGKLSIGLVMPKVDIGYQDWPVPPVGIAYVSAALKSAGYQVHILNLNLYDNEDDALRTYIHQNNIDIIGTGGLIVNYHTIKDIVNKCKDIKPEILIWVGGSLITFSAIPVMQGIPNIDIGMIGEGEITACEMIHCLEQHNCDISELLNINGLAIRTNEEKIIITKPRAEIEDIDTIPYPDYEGFDYFDMIRKFWNSDSTGIISAPLTTSRSCPFNCTFCSKSGGSKYRQRSLPSIFNELDYLVDKYHVNRILLNDELFANDKDRIIEFCNRIAQYNVKWFVSLRVSKHITAELLQIMKNSGCVQILYGLESGDDTILKSMRKGITASEIERVVKLTYEAGFQVRGNFIFGDTNETLETAKNTLSFIQKHIEYFSSVALSPILLFPGSYLYKKAVENNIISDETKFIEDECPVTNVSQMSDSEYVYLFNELIPIEKVKHMVLQNRNRITNLEPAINRGGVFF